MPSESSKPSNVCHVCGSTSYRYLIERNAQGQMKPGRQLQCNGCQRLFAHVQAWRQGPSGQAEPGMTPPP